MEGKDKPQEKPVDKTDKRGGKTVGLLLRLCQNICSTGKVVILDSGFCVLKGLIELKKVGGYAGAIIKKRRYWPRYIKGYDIEEHMKDNKVGTTDTATGILEGINYNVFAMKEPEFLLKLMSTYGSLEPSEKQEEACRVFKQPDRTIQII